MSIERQGLLKFRGQDVTIIGEDIRIGVEAPDFTVMTKEWSWVKALESQKGKVRIVGSLPSLSTDVCDRETRHFNQAASSLSSDIAILMVSMDLPFTLNQWCAAADIERVITLSDHFKAEFGVKYGVLVKELRIFRRAIFVIDRDDITVYREYLPAIGEEPDYGKVLEAAKNALV
ncbi:MAG: thiol peroxidase [Anaerolineales bacterium]|jgi:thiol peroxidase